MKGYFIPPANEVWGKVMFLHLSVSHSVQRGLCMMSFPVWLPGPMFLLGGSMSLVPCSFQEGSVSRGQSLSRGVLCGEVSVWEGVSVRETPPYGEERAVRILLECFLLLSYFSMAAIIPDFRLICLRFSKDRSLGQRSMRKPQAHRHTSVCTILS